MNRHQRRRVAALIRKGKPMSEKMNGVDPAGPQVLKVGSIPWLEAQVVANRKQEALFRDQAEKAITAANVYNGAAQAYEKQLKYLREEAEATAAAELAMQAEIAEQAGDEVAG